MLVLGLEPDPSVSVPYSVCATGRCKTQFLTRRGTFRRLDVLFCAEFSLRFQSAGWWHQQVHDRVINGTQLARAEGTFRVWRFFGPYVLRRMVRFILLSLPLSLPSLYVWMPLSSLIYTPRRKLHLYVTLSERQRRRYLMWGPTRKVYSTAYKWRPWNFALPKKFQINLVIVFYMHGRLLRA